MSELKFRAIVAVVKDDVPTVVPITASTAPYKHIIDLGAAVAAEAIVQGYRYPCFETWQECIMMTDLDGISNFDQLWKAIGGAP